MSSFPWNGWVLPPRGMSFPGIAPFSLLQAAVDEVVNNLQAPSPLVWASALTALSVVEQGLIDVRKPSGQVVPTSLNSIGVAVTGERKTTIENVFMAPIRDFQIEQVQLHQQAMAEWQLEQDLWLARRKILLREVVSGNSPSTELSAHERTKPVPPKSMKLIYEDSTPEALFYGLSQGGGSAGLISSEGGAILNGRALSDMEKMNAIWSGSPITVDRKDGDSYLVQDARLTVSFQVQPCVIDAYMERHGEQAMGSGLLARFLVCMPASTQGTRFIQNGTLSWEHGQRFAQRLTELIRQHSSLVSAGALRERKVVEFTPEAGQLWLCFFNATEGEIRPGGRFEGAGGHASKLAENVARVAALAHFFEGCEGGISVATLNFAITYCLYCSDEFMRLFMPPPQEQLDARELWGWLANLYNSGRRYVGKNYVRQFCLNKLRQRGRLDAALEVLRLGGSIGFVSVGRTLALDLQPCLPGDQQRAYLEVRPGKSGGGL